jgi:hypothetical protein
MGNVATIKGDPLMPTSTLVALGEMLDAAVKAANAGKLKWPQCSKCGKSLVFIRDRNFPDGSGRVWMCENPNCESFQLYVYPNPQNRDSAIPVRITK